jgi:hypothetical protein
MMIEFRAAGHGSISAHAGSGGLLRANLACFSLPKVL